MNILHLVTHLGGGVGTVLLNWATVDKNIHSFICLGYNLDEVIDRCKREKIELYNQASHEFICDFIRDRNVDIVIIHYWNHPLLVNFIVNAKLPKCRLIIYSHIGGKSIPYVIPNKLLDYSDRLVHSSLSTKNANEGNTIMSAGGVDKYKNIQLKSHDGFNILYIGTLDFSKLRSDFIEICNEIIKKIPTAKFTVCGIGFSQDEIVKKAQDMKISDRFLFTGLTKDLSPYLEVADAFIYPLSPSHYGTGEQVLGEAMTCGIVPIVFNNSCEMQIVKNLKNGFVVENKEQFAKSVKILHDDLEIKNKLSINAKATALEVYSVEKFIYKWDVLFNEIMSLEKKERNWETDLKYECGTVVFLESLGDESKIFKEYINAEKKLEQILDSSHQWKSDSKGSLKQYLKHFPEDMYLNKFQNILDKTQ